LNIYISSEFSILYKSFSGKTEYYTKT